MLLEYLCNFDIKKSNDESHDLTFAHSKIKTDISPDFSGKSNLV